MRLLIVVCVVFAVQVTQCFAGNVIPVLLGGVFGTPGYFKEYSLKFDPNVALRRSNEFQAENGPLARGLIEKLGLGMDGMQARRLEEQRLRDSGIPYEPPYVPPPSP